MVHRGAEGIYGALYPFHKGRRIAFSWWADKFTPDDLTYDDLMEYPGDGQHSGFRILDKTATAIWTAANTSGVTAISEYDAIVIDIPETSDDVLIGSRILDARYIGGDGFEADTFLHAPWITTQAGWQKINAVVDSWRSTKTLPLSTIPVEFKWAKTECGYPDRWLSLAALEAGMTLEETGWSENTLAPGDHARITADRHTYKTLHGIKHPETIQLVCSTISPT